MIDARETNAITSRLVLLYAERVGGEPAVERILRIAGFEDRRESFLNESYWFSYDEKIRLFEAAVEGLDDPEAILRIGDYAMDLNVGEGLKVALRALGSPRLVYQNVVRANSKFSSSHTMELLARDRDRATIRYSDVTDRRRYHRLDCQYNRGMLACIPRLFGQPSARINHPVCGCEGGDGCLYEISWVGAPNAVRTALASGTVAAASLLGGALDRRARVGSIALTGGLAAWNGWRLIDSYRTRLRQLEHELGEQSRVSEQLGETLQDLVSDLRIDEVLSKVTRNAQATLPGKEFALLVGQGPDLHCADSTAIPAESVERLVAWAADARLPEGEPLTIDDVATLSGLEPLCAGPAGGFRSVCAIPLVFRERALGTLVALAPGARSFLPRDLDVIGAYAAQTAIAIANGQLYRALEDLANHDHLTGLLNHREFHETVAAELDRCRRYGGEFSVVLFDLDRFKDVNDAHGHATGDRVLHQVGEALRASCRSSDLAYRIGGDEFALLLANTDGRVAEIAADRARAQVNTVPPGLDAAYGIAVWPGDDETKDGLLGIADARLYAMKRKERTLDPS